MRIGDKPLKDLSDRELEEELRRRRRARGQPVGAEPAARTERAREAAPRRAPPRREGRHPGWKVRQWYRNLELAPGASRDEVEVAYVRLSEKYHPDRHPDPEKRRVATQLAAGLREAYRGLLEALGDEE
ncbi:MAG: J domain-containing protein [Sandaracinaceae bacterium]|nr:J domain-containing protein [Sandaracinaceae bacterium]